MKKLLIIFTVILSVLIFKGASTEANTNLDVHVFGTKAYYNPSPYAVNGVTLVPANQLANSIGASYSYNSKTKTVTLTQAKKTITIKIGATSGKLVTKVPQSNKVYSKEFKYGTKAALKNSVPMIPLKFVADAFGYKTYFKNGIAHLEIDYTPSNNYNWHLAVASANISEQSYSQKAEVINAEIMQLQTYGFKNVALIDVDQGIFKLSPTQAIVGVKTLPDNKKVYAISFRGTESLLKIDDVAIDLMDKLVSSNSCSQCKVATGFNYYTNSFINYQHNIKLGNKTLKNIIAENDSNNIYWISGHSLGGAAAALYSSRLADMGIDRSKIVTYTFGAPRFANTKFANHYKNKFYYHRITNEHDPVVHLPFKKDSIINKYILSKDFTSFGNRHIVYHKEAKSNVVQAVFSKSEHSLSTYLKHVKTGNILTNQ